MSERYDVVIVGAGPAGLTAAIYASRANLSVLIIEAGVNGGKLSKTYEIENYPGIKSISGLELANQLTEHGQQFGAKLIAVKSVPSKKARSSKSSLPMEPSTKPRQSSLRQEPRKEPSICRMLTNSPDAASLIARYVMDSSTAKNRSPSSAAAIPHWKKPSIWHHWLKK